MNKHESVPTKPGVRCSSHLGCTQSVNAAIARRMAGEDPRALRTELERSFSPAEIDAAIALELDRVAIEIAAEEARASFSGRKQVS